MGYEPLCMNLSGSTTKKCMLLLSPWHFIKKDQYGHYQTKSIYLYWYIFKNYVMENHNGFKIKFLTSNISWDKWIFGNTLYWYLINYIHIYIDLQLELLIFDFFLGITTISQIVKPLSRLQGRGRSREYYQGAGERVVENNYQTF